MRLLLTAAFLALTAPALAQEPKGDLAKLQGKWVAHLGPNGDHLLTWEIKGDKLTSKTKTAEGENVTSTCTLKLNEKANPKHIDMIDMLVNFEEHGETKYPDTPGIYKLDGDDLTASLPPVNEPRPTEFAKDDPKANTVFKRVKGEAKAKG